METAIVTVLCVALMIVGGMTMSRGFISSAETASSGLMDVQSRNEQILRTDLSAVSAQVTDDESVEVVLRNSGQTKLCNYEKWDFIIQYYDQTGQYHIKWLPFASSSPGYNQWTIAGLYISKSSEIVESFEPGILNPGEEIVLRGVVDPAVGSGTAVQVIVSTPNGIPASLIFVRP